LYGRLAVLRGSRCPTVLDRRHGKEDTLDYAIAPAKFEGGEFRGLIFRPTER